jgi:hypothetical protein
MPEKLAEAVVQGNLRTVSDPAFWSAIGIAIQKHARDQAGGWLFGGIRVALSKLGWFMLIGLIVYMLGGWSALLALWKSLSVSGHA